MGMQVEFNWYLVIKENDHIQEIEDGPIDSETFVQVITHRYERITKEGARVYPIGGVVPLIKEGVCIGLVHIRQTSHITLGSTIKTVIDYDSVLTFKENDPVAEHYTTMYLTYKKKQEVENHGGRFKTEDFINALERKNFEELLKHSGHKEE